MDPRLLALIGVIFVAIGGFSFTLARKRLRYARMQGQPAAWYKDLGFMTSIEYMLLGIIVFLNLSGNIKLPDQLRAIRDFLYASILFLAIVCLLTVVFLGFKKPRRGQLAPQPVANREANIDTQSPEERTAETQRKRERRQKAAAARRRHAGRA